MEIDFFYFIWKEIEFGVLCDDFWYFVIDVLSSEEICGLKIVNS